MNENGDLHNTRDACISDKDLFETGQEGLHLLYCEDDLFSFIPFLHLST